ncbi:MAG: TIR domain-containing protein [Anaerolineales bacterium]
MPPSVDWMAEVHEAIEGADTFVFIISDTSVESEICGLEIEHAIENNKRLVPIVISDIEAERVPRALRALNWIFFQDRDEIFEQATRDLIAALQTDHAWVKMHTRLQTRALEWDRKNQDGGYLLRGSDLQEAEAWLSAAKDKDPQPTALQTEYLLASRAAATRRQRQTLIAVAAVMILSIGLGIFAWTQRNTAVSESNARATEVVVRQTAQAEAVMEADFRATAQAEAEDAQTLAEEQRDLALSGELTAYADQQLNEGDWDLSLTLAVEAANYADTDRAFQMLRQVLNHPGQIVQIVDVPNGNKGNIYLSPDESYFLVLEQDGVHGIAYLWPLGASEAENTFEVDGSSAVWSPNSDLIAVWGRDTVEIWDVFSGKRLHSNSLGTGITPKISGVTWNAAGDEILFYSDSGGPHEGVAMIYDLDAKKIVTTFSGHTERILVATWSPEEDRILTAARDLTARVWDAQSGEELLRLEGHKNTPRGARWSSDGQYILTWSSGGDVHLWDANTGEQIYAFDELGIAIGAQWNAAEDRILAHGYSYEPVIVWNVETGIDEFNVEIDDFLLSPSWSPDETTILTGSQNGEIDVWNAQTSEKLLSFPGQWGFLHFIGWSPDGKYIIASGSQPGSGSRQGITRLWDIETGELVTVLGGHQGGVSKATWIHDSELLLTESDTRTVLWTLTPDSPLPEFRFEDYGEGVAALIWLGEPNTLLAASGEVLHLIDVAEGKELKQIETAPVDHYTDRIEDVWWNSSVERALSISNDGWVAAWNLTSGTRSYLVGPGKKIYTPLGDYLPRERFLDAAWSPDGALGVAVGCTRDPDPGLSSPLMWAACDEGLIRIFDAKNGNTLQMWSGYANVRSVIWSADGRRILVGGSTADGDSYHWVADVDALDAQIFLEDEYIFDELLWNMDSEEIISISSEGTTIWDANSGGIVSHFENADQGIKIDWVTRSPNQNEIAIFDTDGAVHFWETTTWKPLRTFTLHEGAINSAVWIDNGDALVTSSSDGTAKVWDAHSGEVLQTLIGHEGAVNLGLWDPTNARIITGGVDNTVRQWHLAIEDLIATACERAPRNLSEEEWTSILGDLPFHEICPISNTTSNET